MIELFIPFLSSLGSCKVVKKSWGEERIIISNDAYCFKILHYYKKGNFSSTHFHRNKHETWLINGLFKFYYYDELGNKEEVQVKKGDIIHLSRGVPHQLIAMEDGAEVYEVSTKDDSTDVIRIGPTMK